MKVMIVKEVMAGDILPVAMFVSYIPHDLTFNPLPILLKMVTVKGIFDAKNHVYDLN